MTSAERIFALLNERGISAYKLSKAVGITQGNIGDWKNGKAKPSYGALVKIANYFDVSVEYLECKTNDPALIAKDMCRLDEREQRLVDGLRAAPASLRDTVFTVSFATLGAHVPGVGASAAPEPVFSGSDGGEVSHHGAPDTVLKSYPKLAQLGVRKGLGHGTYKPVQGKVAAGPPIAAVREDEKRVIVPVKYTGEQYFIVQVEGDSMLGLVSDGDYCVLDKRGFYDNGHVVLVQVDGRAGEPDATLKRVYRRPGNRVELRSENPKYQPMIYPADEVVIMGELVAVLPPDSCVLPAR